MSMRSLAAEKDESKKVVKKGDKFSARFSALNIEPGHNERNMHHPKTKAHVVSLFTALMNGGELPPLDVRVDSDDKVWVVDGECRYQAYEMAIKAGCEIDWIDVLHYTGNDAERTQKMLTSNQGLELTPLEIGRGYKRLHKSFGWAIEKIALGSGKSTEHVKSLLILANANTDVHQFVTDDVIGGWEAIDVIKKHGEKAGAYIREQFELNQKIGKSRVTKGSMEGKALPRKIVTDLISSVGTFASHLNNGTRTQLAAMEKMGESELQGKTVEIEVSALLELLRAQGAVDDARNKQLEKSRVAESKASQIKLDV